MINFQHQGKSLAYWISIQVICVLLFRRQSYSPGVQSNYVYIPTCDNVALTFMLSGMKAMNYTPLGYGEQKDVYEFYTSVVCIEKDKVYRTVVVWHYQPEQLDKITEQHQC